MILGSSIDVGATVAPSGGTATDWGSRVRTSNAHRFFLKDGATNENLVTLEASVKEPKVSSGAPNGYTQGRSKLKLQHPLPLDNDKQTVNSVTCETSFDPEATAAERLEARQQMAQMLVSADMVDFWDNQSDA